MLRRCKLCMKNIKDIALNIIKDKYTKDFQYSLGEDVFEHCSRTCDIALQIAEVYGFNLQQKIDLATGALLHDIGKSYVNQDVLNKAKKLTQDDRTLIECHPQYGFWILKQLDFNRTVVDIVYHHHERLDGSGYPQKLRGHKIDILTQIVSAADVYEALTADRVYHKKRSKEEALKIMKSDKGLNQVAVDILTECC